MGKSSNSSEINRVFVNWSHLYGFVSAAIFDACFLLVLIINFSILVVDARFIHKHMHTCMCREIETTTLCVCVLLLFKDLSLLFLLLRNLLFNFLLLCLFIVCYPLSKIKLCTHQWFRSDMRIGWGFRVSPPALKVSKWTPLQASWDSIYTR